METIYDSQAILGILPHRYPFVLVDRIVEFNEKDWIVGIKNVAANEPCFEGHFPGQPVFPGVLQLEAMAQVGGILQGRKDGLSGNLPLFMGIDNVKFRRMIGPGDQMRIEVEIVNTRGTVVRVHGRVLVDGQLASEADLLFMWTNRKVEA